jgi:hypothetical protein
MAGVLRLFVALGPPPVDPKSQLIVAQLRGCAGSRADCNAAKGAEMADEKVPAVDEVLACQCRYATGLPKRSAIKRQGTRKRR